MSFFERVYKIVKKIPKGRVATYGQIATILTEEPKNQKTEERVNTRTKELESSKTKKQTTARIVGWALHANKNPDIPCHRVVNKEGKIAVNFAFAGGWREQKRRLLAEGIGFVDDMNIDLDKYLWMGLANHGKKMQKCIKG